MVLSVHIKQYLEGVPALFDKILSFGAYGVALYFLLSGFFSFPSVKKANNIKIYMKKKALRILPMYYISLLVTFFVGVFITKEYPLDFKWLYHVCFLNMFIPNLEWAWWNSVNYFWTMPSFIAWYIISSFIFKKLDNSRKLACVTMTASVAAPFLKKWMYTFASEQFVNWNFFCLLYVFLLGALAYFVIAEKKQKTGIVYGIAITVVGLATENRSGFFIFGACFYFLIIGTSILQIEWNNQMINTLIKYFSALTYPVYLTHWFVLTAFQSILSKLSWIVGYVVFMLLAWMVGWLAFQFLDQPIHHYFKSNPNI